MFHVPRSWSGNVAVLVLLVASLTSGCVPAPAPVTAERVTPTPAPIGTVVTPVSAVLSITPINAAAVSPVVLVAITTATPAAAATGAAASAPASPAPSPTQAPVAVTPAGGSAAPQQPPEQIASSGRITSVQLSSLNPVQLPCPDPRITIGVLPVPASSEVTLSCQAVDATQVQQVIMGNVLQAGVGQAPARQAGIYAGIPVSAGAVTVNKVCGSGLKAVMLAAQAIQCGDAQLVIAGGCENISAADDSVQPLY